MGYVPVNENWVTVRQWILSTPQKVRGAILSVVQFYFGFSPVAQIALLTRQRQLLLDPRNLIRDKIQNVYIPFRDNPPAGVDAEVIDVVKDHIVSQKKIRNALTERITEIDERIVSLGE